MSFSEDETDCPAARAPLSPVIEMPPEYPEDEDGSSLVPCSVCGRTFNPNSLQRHEKVCEKLQAKKRRKFDSTKQRQDGLDLPPSSGLNSKEARKEDKKKKSRWREKHQEFLRTIRAAKGNPDDSQDGNDGSPQRNIPSDYIQCPHCERHFGPKAADRHINWCSEQKNRLPRSQTSGDAEAINRLKTRTKYTPPKPGQNGWRAPKKKDVISSIPPPNVGANPTPPGRLVTPPPPSAHQTSPPPVPPPPTGCRVSRHFSPPPQSPSRKTSPASLPPGAPRYGTGSLGRSAGKHFSAMLQSVTGCSPSYGVSTGYGSHSLYGNAPVQGQPPTFNRSASLRLPKRRSLGAGTTNRMARHRDLASDMLASVTLGSKPKREEPEGDEAANMTPFFDRSPSSKTDIAPYDPFSAAELQFQDLLGPSKLGNSLRSDMMGSTNSLKNFGLKRFSPEREFNSTVLPKPRRLTGGGSLSLCSLGIDTFDMNSRNLRSHGDDSSDLESLENSPRELRSPDNDDVEEFLSKFDSYKRQESSVSSDEIKRHYRGDNPLNTGHRQASRSRSLSSQSSRSLMLGTELRNQGEGSNSLRKSSSPPSITIETYSKPSSSNILDSLSKYSSKEKSPSAQSRKFSPSYKADNENDIDGHSVSYNAGWTSNSDLLGSPKNYSRHFGGKGQTGTTSSSANSAHDSIKALRATLDEELKIQKKTIDSLDSQQQRVSSSSSTDSSLPQLASPSVSPTGRSKSSLPSHASLPTFCYECGNKYPVSMAKFCCHCGAKRLVVAK